MEKHGIQQDLFPSVGKRQLAQLKLRMIEQLQSQLDRYLGSVLDILGLPPRELLDFLEYKYNVSAATLLEHSWYMLGTKGRGEESLGGIE